MSFTLFDPDTTYLIVAAIAALTIIGSGIFIDRRAHKSVALPDRLGMLDQAPILAVCLFILSLALCGGFYFCPAAAQTKATVLGILAIATLVGPCLAVQELFSVN
jgi:hypothetical protein